MESCLLRAAVAAARGVSERGGAGRETREKSRD
jgi:hypothetical protein